MNMHADARPDARPTAAIGTALALALCLLAALPVRAQAADLTGGTEVTVTLENQVVEEVEVSDSGSSDLAQTGSGRIVAAIALITSGTAGTICLARRWKDGRRRETR